MNRTSFVLSLILSLSVSAHAFAAQTGAVNNTSTDLKSLEYRFFMHDFTKEPIEERLNRMEKFTFGETLKGSPESRVARLDTVLQSHSPSKPLSSIDIESAKLAMKPPSQSFQPAPAVQDDDDEDRSTEYPHITFLEQEILGKSFAGDPLKVRLKRLETKAFGSPSGNPDLSARTDRLERYAEQNLHKPAFAHRNDVPDDDYDAPPALPPLRTSGDSEASSPTPPPEGARLISRVAWCEQHLYGRTFPELHVLERLHQLNSKLFPNEKTKDIQLMDHVDAIVKAVVLLQHPPAGR